MSNVNIPFELARRAAYFASRAVQRAPAEESVVTTTAVPETPPSEEQKKESMPWFTGNHRSDTLDEAAQQSVEAVPEVKPRKRRRKADVTDADGDGIPDSEEEQRG